MRNARSGWGLFLALLALGSSLTPIEARMIGTNPTGTSADQVCWGGRVRGGTAILTTEACLDSSGNLIPTTTNTGALGTASLQWSGLQIAGTSNLVGATTQGSAGTANSAGTGNATFPVNTTLSGGIVLNQSMPYVATAVGGINASTTIAVTAGYMVLTSSNGAITVTATPSISTTTLTPGTTAIPAGFILVVTSTQSTAITLQDQGTLAGSQLALGAATRALSATKHLVLIWDPNIGSGGTKGRWSELSYGNNQGN